MHIVQAYNKEMTLVIKKPYNLSVNEVQYLL